MEIEIDIAEEPAWIYGDEKLLRRAVGNLLWNVIKYNNTGKKVVVQVSQEDEKVILVVADDGEQLIKHCHRIFFCHLSEAMKQEEVLAEPGLDWLLQKRSSVSIKAKSSIAMKIRGINLLSV